MRFDAGAIGTEADRNLTFSLQSAGNCLRFVQECKQAEADRVCDQTVSIPESCFSKKPEGSKFRR